MKRRPKPTSNVASSAHMVTSPGVMLFLVVAGILFSLGGLFPPALFCLISAAVAAVSYHWALHVLDHVHVQIKPDRTELFPGDCCRLRICVENRKWIPLIWLTLRVPMEPTSPVLPEQKTEFIRLEIGTERVQHYYERTISFLSGQQQFSYNSTFLAQHRGVFPIHGIQLISGDGLSLSVRESAQSLTPAIAFAVFPRLIPVSTQWFQTHSWEVENGLRGLQDDKSVIRNIRPYVPGDNARALNVRLMAKGLGPMVNVHEKISPKKITFLLDGTSFCDLPSDVFEESLEILASLVSSLSREHVTVSLLTSRSKEEPERFAVARNEREVRELLILLAAYSPSAPLTCSGILRNLPRLSNTFCICGKAEQLSPSVISLIADRHIPLFCWGTQDFSGLFTKDLRSFRTGGDTIENHSHSQSSSVQ